MAAPYVPDADLLREVSGLLGRSQAHKVPKYGPRTADLAATPAGSAPEPASVPLSPGSVHAFLSRVERPAHHFLVQYEVPFVAKGASEVEEGSLWDDKATHMAQRRIAEHHFAALGGGKPKLGPGVFKAPWRATGVIGSDAVVPLPEEVQGAPRAITAAVLSRRPDATCVAVHYCGAFARVNASSVFLPLEASADPRVALLAATQAGMAPASPPHASPPPAPAAATAEAEVAAAPPQLPVTPTPSSGSALGSLPPLPGVGGTPLRSVPLGAVARGGGMGAGLEAALSGSAPPPPTARPTMDQLEAACMASILQASLQRVPAEEEGGEGAVAVVTTHHLFLTPQGALIPPPATLPPQPLAQVLVPGLPYGGVSLGGGAGGPALRAHRSSVATRVEYLNLTPRTTWVEGWGLEASHAPLPGATQHTLPLEALEAAASAAAAKWTPASP